MLYQILLYSILIASLVICFTAIPANPERSLRMIPLFLLYNLISELSAYGLMVQKRSNMFIYDIYTLLEFVFIFILLFASSKSIRFKRVMSFYGLLFLAAAILFYFGWYKPTHYNILNLFMSFMFIIVASGAVLIEQLFSDEVIRFTSIPLFWASTGFLIYASASFLINTLNYLNIVFPSSLMVKQVITVIGSLAFYGGLSMSMLCRRIFN